MGNHAIVVGAGIGGLLFARVLSDYFDRVTVLERDWLGDKPEARPGVPQGRHFHGLLPGGCRAMDALLPGLEDDFKAMGAVKLIVGLSTRYEMPGYDPFPRRDAGLYSYSLSRPLLELCVRRRVQAIANILWKPNSGVQRLQHAAGAVTGVVLRDGRSLPADLVIDASGRGDLTMNALDEMDYPRPRETAIGVDLRYTTALFEIPEDAAHEWDVLVTFPDTQPASKGGMMAVIEGNRWICGLAWQGEEEGPFDRESFVDFSRKLRTQTYYRAIKDATMAGPLARFLFRESCHRHFSELSSLPKGVLPVADAICRFNPVYGQGMSVAALEAEVFRQLLASGVEDLHHLASVFLQQTDQIIAGPWNMAALPDLAYPGTRGERPPHLMQALQFGAAFNELAARDSSVHKLMLEIRSLVKPYSALTSDPVLMQRIQAVMAEMAQQKMAEAAAV